MAPSLTASYLGLLYVPDWKLKVRSKTMSQTTNQPNTAKKKPYHTPQLQKFGNVSELTLTNVFGTNSAGDGGTFPASYAS